MKKVYMLFSVLLLIGSILYSEEMSDEDYLFMFMEDGSNSASVKELPENPSIEITKIEFVLGEGVSEDWIRTFLDFDIGWSGKEDDLVELLEYNEKKILATGLFYNINLVMLEALDPLSKNRIVLVDITDGFWYGFNFEMINLTLIFKNLNERGQRLGTTIGATVQRLWYDGDYILNLPLSFLGMVKHDTELWENPGFLRDEFLTYIQPGVKLTPWLDLKLDGGYKYISFPKEYFYYNDFNYSLGSAEQTSYGLDVSYKELFLGSKLETQWESYKESGPTNIDWQLTGNYHFAEKNYVSVSSSLKMQIHSFDILQVVFSQYLYYQDDLSKVFLKKRPLPFLYYQERLAGILYRGPAWDVLGDQALSFNLDLLLNNVITIEGNVVNIDFQPLGIVDYAIFPENNQRKIAIGVGMNVYLSPPVDMHFNFILSTNVTDENPNIGFHFVSTDKLF